MWSDFCNNMNTSGVMKELRFSELCLKIQVFCDNRNWHCWCCKDHSAFIFRLKQSILLTLLASQDEGSSNLEYKNYSTNNAVSHSKRHESSATPLWEPQNLTATSLVLLPHACKYQFLIVVSDLINLTGTYEGWNFNSGNYLFTTDTK